MSDIATYYRNAEVAFAAYADLSPGTPDIDQLEDDGRGMTLSQATSFAETWQVVDQFNDELRPGYIGLYSGLSVTLFENRESGDQVVAIRGTNDLQDLGTDVEDVLLRGTGKYQAQYSVLTDKVQEWLDDGTMGRSVRMPYRSARLEPGRRKALVRRGRVIPFSKTTTQQMPGSRRALRGLASRPCSALRRLDVATGTPAPTRLDHERLARPEWHGIRTDLPLEPGFSVTGHSLGGFLAQLLTIDRADVVSEADTFNAPGIGGVSPVECNREMEVSDGAGVEA